MVVVCVFSFSGCSAEFVVVGQVRRGPGDSGVPLPAHACRIQGRGMLEAVVAGRFYSNLPCYEDLSLVDLCKLVLLQFVPRLT